MGVSLISAGARYMGWLPPMRNTPFIYINYQSNDLSDQSRISYSEHKYLENKGECFKMTEPLNYDNVMKILTENQATLNFHVNISIDIIKRILSGEKSLNKYSGIFIHGDKEGYVMIKSCDKELNSSRVMSIRI